jgi:hypothetical protein
VKWGKFALPLDIDRWAQDLAGEAREVIDRLDLLRFTLRALACACVGLVPLAVRSVLSPIHAPFSRRLQLEPFERKPNRVSTRSYRMDWPIKLGRDDFWAGPDLGHPPKEVVLIRSPAAARGSSHLRRQSSCAKISGLQISPSGVGLQPMQNRRAVEHILRGIVLAEKRSQGVTLKFFGPPLPLI